VRNQTTSTTSNATLSIKNADQEMGDIGDEDADASQ
jgi:hypothetical protein